MKKLFSLLVAAMMATTIFAQTTTELRIMKGDVAAYSIDIEEIDSIIFVETETPALPKEGILNGAFSVGEEKTVQFSQGNLQYQASTETWRFAENQWDAIGADNENISDTYDGWIDLFGWGTGSNPTLTSKNSSDYSTFTDWGVNEISNGGNIGNAWRTLTKNEWLYLFHERDNAEELFSIGTVHGVKGVIVLPDDWATSSLSSLVTFKSITEIGFVWNNSGFYNHPDNDPMVDDYTLNTFSPADWYVLELAGAVFLPATGTRTVTGVSSLDTGNYWTASSLNVNTAFNINLGSFINIQTGTYPYSGYGVRLVR